MFGFDDGILSVCIWVILAWCIDNASCIDVDFVWFLRGKKSDLFILDVDTVLPSYLVLSVD